MSTRSIARKLRGALGTALTWGVAWAVAVFVVLGVSLRLWGDPDYFWLTLGPLTVLTGLSGFTGGAVFSTLLGTIRWRRTLDELHPVRMAFWGAGAAVIVPLGLTVAGVVTGISREPDVLAVLVLALAGLGAVTAGGTVKLAQAAERSGQDRSRPPPGLEGRDAPEGLISGD